MKHDLHIEDRDGQEQEEKRVAAAAQARPLGAGKLAGRCFRREERAQIRFFLQGCADAREKSFHVFTSEFLHFYNGYILLQVFAIYNRLRKNFTKAGEVYIFCDSVGGGSPVQATAANMSVRSKHFVEKTRTRLTNGARQGTIERETAAKRLNKEENYVL